MGKTSIEWTDESWPVVNGCRRISPGCGGAAKVGGCYAERLASTRLSKTKKYGGLAVFQTGRGPQWTGETRLWEPELDMPLRLKTPSRIFVADMGDLFYEGVADEVIDRVMAVMLLAPRHTFQVLTKRAKRMREYLTSPSLYERVLDAAREFRDRRPELTQVGISNPTTMPAPWIWFGVSVENQKYADERIPHLLAVPAAVRFVSYEPALGPIDFTDVAVVGDSLSPECWGDCACDSVFGHDSGCRRNGGDGSLTRKINWIIVGGESGPGARPFDVDWGRSVLKQCRGTRTAAFFKQFGARAFDSRLEVQVDAHTMRATTGNFLSLKHRKGADMSEWDESLRVREFPEVSRG